MAAVLVVLCFLDTFLTGALLRSVGELKQEHEFFRDLVQHPLCPDGPMAVDDDGGDDER